MDCVVTGGAGFIGSNLVDALVARGDRVAVIDDLSTGKLENLAGALAAGVELHELDVRDAAAVAGVFDEVRPAARLPPRRPDRRAAARSTDPASDADVNVLRRDQRARRRHAARRRAASSTPRPAVGSTATPTCCRRRRITRSSRWRPTGRASTRPRATSSSTRACTGSRPCRCATATSTARARTSTARPASSRSSAVACLRAGRPRCSATGARRATGSTWPMSSRANLLAADVAADRPAEHRARPGDLGARPRARRWATSVPRHGLTLPDPEFLPARPGEVSRSCLDVSRAREELGWPPRSRCAKASTESWPACSRFKACGVVDGHLAGAKLIRPRVYGDARGFFLETYRAGALADLGLVSDFVQDNHSRSRHGDRAWHALPARAGEARAMCTRCDL